MVTAIIFDCFGVLTTEGWLPFKSKHFGHDPVRYKEAGDLVKQANAGLISYEDFLERIAGLIGLSTGEVSREIRQNVPNEQLFNYIRQELKPRFKIGFLSNVADDYMRKLFTEEQRGLLDAVTLSYKTGFIKPQEQAYLIAAQDLGAEPRDCILVDDSASNVAGARATGMKAILYKDFEEFKSELERILAADSKS